LNIWIFNQYADSPDRQTTAHFDLGVQLVARGHHVTVFSAGFNHYKRQEEHASHTLRYVVQEYDGVRFVWLRTFPYQGNGWRRSVNMLTYAWQALLASGKLGESPDAVIGTCPQPFGALAACWVASREQAPFFFEVRDIWPQTLVESGGLSKRNPAYWVLSAIEKLLYRKSQMILSVLPHINIHTEQLGIPKEKVVWIPNGVDLSRFGEMKPLQSNAMKSFTAMYLGGLARYNGVQVILEAARRLKAMGENDIRFVIFGDGPERERLVEKSRAWGLDQVELKLPVPKADIWKVMQEADVFVFHVNDLPVLRYGISSNKLCDYLASGRPVLFAAHASNNPVAEAGAGISIPPEDPQQMAEALVKLRDLPFEERAQMGRNGAEYASKQLNTRLLALRLESALFGTHPSERSLLTRPFEKT